MFALSIETAHGLRKPGDRASRSLGDEMEVAPAAEAYLAPSGPPTRDVEVTDDWSTI